jgi:hypothetical protein
MMPAQIARSIEAARRRSVPPLTLRHASSCVQITEAISASIEAGIQDRDGLTIIWTTSVSALPWTARGMSS